MSPGTGSGPKVVRYHFNVHQPVTRPFLILHISDAHIGNPDYALLAPAVYDFGELLKDLPPGAWVAISHDEQRVVAYAAEMRDAVKKANEAGEQDPIVSRVPLSPCALLF